MCATTTTAPDLVLPSDIPIAIAQNSNKHKSVSEDLISNVSVIEVDGNMAVCTGGTCLDRRSFATATSHRLLVRRHPGGGAMGHPIEYIQLNTTDPSIPQVCKYCGLKYVRKGHH